MRHWWIAALPLCLGLWGCAQGGSESPASGAKSAAPAASAAPLADAPPAAAPVTAASEAPIASPAKPGEAPAAPSPQSGLLTAGSFDDNRNFDAFRDYLSQAGQKAQGAGLPQWTFGRRAVIRVQSVAGQPLGDARVTVHAGRREQAAAGELARQPALLDLTTGSDGRVLFLTGIDAADAGTEFTVTVSPPDGSEPRSEWVTLDQPDWTVTLSFVEPALPRQLDLALVIDATGSMSDELEYLKAEIASIAAAVKEKFPNVDQRFALIVYRDEGDDYVTRKFDFTASLERFQQDLSAQRANGGGDYPEAMHLALEQAGEFSWRPRDTARVLFLVGDAPPHARFAQRTFTAINRLRNRGVSIFPIAASGVAEQAEFIMRTAAFSTLGQYLFLTDHSGVGNPHAAPQVPAYEVERLDQLMIRMIASKLSGRETQPARVIDTVTPPAAAPPAPEPEPWPAGSQTTTAAASGPTSWGGWQLVAVGLLLVVVLIDSRPWESSR